MTRRMRRVLPLLLGLLLTPAGAAFAQDAGSRAEAEARKQQQKAASLSQYKPNFIERKILEIENEGGLGNRTGLFVTFGDIKRGSGLAGGPAFGWVRPNGTKLVAKAGYSINNYKLLQLSAHVAPLFRERLVVSGRARWQDAPGVRLYPLGTDSPNVRAEYAETKTEVSGQALFRPVRLLRFGGGLAFERYRTGLSHSTPPPGFLVPDLGVDPSYLHSHASAAIDSRDGDGYSRHGTLLRGTFHDYRQQDDNVFTFQRVDGDAEQYLPILHGNWVVFLGLHASTTSTAAGQKVPFFLMPDLGGHDLRGFSNYRFRDLHSIYMTAEYRWYAQEFLDAAIFYDAGKVVPDRDSLNFSGFKSSVGAGIRLHSPQMTFLRIEVAKSKEGMRILFAFTPVGQ
jgi:Omp85 superfamily domain